MTTLATTTAAVKTDRISAPLVADIPGLPTYAEVSRAISGIGVTESTRRAVLDAFDREAWSNVYTSSLSGREVEELAYAAAARVLANRLLNLPHDEADERWWARLTMATTREFFVEDEPRRTSRPALARTAKTYHRAPSDRCTADTCETQEFRGGLVGHDA